nr:SAM-dependent chlorinase/fluorinase [Micromonospora sp. DSM 115978]
MAGLDCISLTTDFGLADGFAAQVLGTLARLAPAARVIEVTHLVPARDVRRGATVLARAVPYLPRAVHVGSVGAGDRPIVVSAPGGMLVGPDNGLLLPAASALGGVDHAVELADPDWFAASVHPSFHGRDVYAPAAARLAAGVPPGDAGPPVDPARLVRLPEPTVEVGPGWLAVEVLGVDHFGNLQLAAPGAALDHLGRQVLVDGRPAVRCPAFTDAPVGGLVVYVDPAGMAAVAVNGGRAADLLGVSTGRMLRITGVG